MGEVLPELSVTNRVALPEHLMFGASGLGCLYADVPPEQADACLDAVWDAGVRYIDTAPWYGAGLSETRLGQYLAKHEDRAAALTLSTKCGRIIRPLSAVDQSDPRVQMNCLEGFPDMAKYHSDIPCADYTADGIMESFRQSCERLGCPTIHCIRLHDAEDDSKFEEATQQGGIDAMVQLRREGKVKEISLGFNKAEYLLKFLRRYPKGTFDTLMSAGSFNLIDQDGLELLQECQRLGIKVTNVGIFASGILWGSAHYKYDSVPPEVAEKAAKWKALAEKYGLKLPQVALAFSLLPDCVEMVAFGCSQPEQVRGNLDLCGTAVPRELWAEAKARGLVAEAVPVPA